MKPKLLIVDDEEEIRVQMKWALADQYEILQAHDRASAIEMFRSASPQVVLLDLGLPPCCNTPEEGLATLSELLALDGLAKIVIITGQGEKENAIQAIGAGAYDLFCKPVEMTDLKLLLQRCFHVGRLEREYRQLSQRVQGDTFEGMMGASPSMSAVFSAIRKVAATDAPVLLLGESGTGKEMAARALHAKSNRKEGPFVAINCGAIPEALLESELFGHEKGAFTSAHAQRKGRIETAEGGTLFLDEVGELSLAMQVKLLRFLQERCIERLGGRQEIQVDVRLIAATNSDLKKAMESGRFREDLYYRLAVVVIKLPALRDRENDIRLLALSFLHRYAVETGKEKLSFDLEALRTLSQHSWPGNVRELENRVKRAIIMTDGKRVTAQDLELGASKAVFAATSLKEARETVEREMVLQALRKHSGKIARASAELGISRPTLYELMEKLNIHRNEHEPQAS